MKELYEIIKSRTSVFLLEQNIVCQDLDDIDYLALHCFFKEDNKVTAYLRAYKSDETTVKIGRVLTLEHKKGLGRKLMEKAFGEIEKHFEYSKICVHAQKQAEGFYAKMGFETVSNEFFEEGVPHVVMEMKK